MKDTEVKRLLYQDSEGFKEGIEVGKMETVDMAQQWFEDRFYNGGCICSKIQMVDIGKRMIYVAVLNLYKKW